ncbi:MAG TPA: hypothetical protein VFG76_13190, partial [Candidatus Polarisedimenticolia bacterium]|nr:hypothetical protein [Candidatus Polarisedimenticolia bacterium]
PAKLTVTYVCEGERSGALDDEPRADDEETAPVGGSRSGFEGCGHRGEVSILDGRVKVGWKVDWALRWYVLGVHYEMYGKDLIESAALSARICKLISGPGGGRGPVQSFYEMFLDEEGRKISKSVGRGLTVDSWLAYAPKESLLLFIFKDPRKAKKLTWGVVTRTVDEYMQLVQRRSSAGAPSAPDELSFIQPHQPAGWRYEYPVTYSMLIGLAAALGAPSPEVVVGYVHHYKGAMPESDRVLESLADYATAYVRDQALPSRVARRLTPDEMSMVLRLAEFLAQEREADEIQTRAFDIAREAEMDPKEFFRLLYNVLTGQDSGPRLGPFVKLMGQSSVADILRKASS